MEATLSQTFESAPVLLLRLDAASRVLEANAFARSLLGENIIGRSLAEWVIDFHGVLDYIALFAPGDVCRALTLKTAAGIPETLHIQFVAEGDGVMAIGGIDFEEMRVLREETLKLNRELSNLTRQVQLANAELRDINTLKNQFIGMAAHDLRAPISVMIAYSDFLMEDADDFTSRQNGFLRTMRSAVLGMKRLIDNFLDVSVIESGQLRLECSQTETSALLEGGLAYGRLAAARKGIDLLVDIACNAGTLQADVPKIQQVLTNLLANAIQHSPQGTTVRLAVSRGPRELVVSVRDEGEGLTLEEQKRLFVPFARAGTRKTAGERSSGLGLAIAQLIVEAHGGRIWIESPPGAGATFLFSLPTHDSPQDLRSEAP
jgi:signal transduction histidine kinase